MISQISSVSFLVYTLLCVESWSTESWRCDPKTGGMLGDIWGVKYRCMQCKWQFARGGQLSELHIFRPSKCRPLLSAARGECLPSPPSRRHWEYAIKRWFVIPPLLNNVSALPGETWTWTPGINKYSAQIFSHLAISFSKRGIQHDWKYTISEIRVSLHSAETLVTRGGMTNHRLIAHSLSNTSGKNN